MRILKIYELVIDWIHKRLNKKQFLIFSSVLVGITAGLAAVVLKIIVHYIHEAITYNYHIGFQYYFYLIFPLIGIILAVFYTQKILNNKLERGTSSVLFAIAKKSSYISPVNMYSHLVTSALTVGFGGSAGLESPIVATGSAIGSNYSKTYHLNYKDRTLLLASGAAAGIAAAFNSPIAGVLFALEVLLVDVSISAFIPLIIAAAAGVLCSKIILNENILLSFQLQQSFDYRNVGFYILLGVLAGLISVYHARVFMKIEAVFSSRKEKVYQNALIGGGLLAVLILFFPSLFGEGYESIKFLSSQKPELLLENSVLAIYKNNEIIVLLFVGIIMLVKVIATAITLGSGGNGGNFAPSLFVGAYLGFFFSRVINFLGISKLPEGNFTIVAMAGILSGVFHAPLTAVFLIAEITGGYMLMIPLMIVSAISYTITKHFEPYSMDTKRLAKKGHIFTHNKDKNILSTLKTSKIIETDFIAVLPSDSLGNLVSIVSSSKRNIFPVVSESNELVGIITLDDLREIMFKTTLYDQLHAKDLMKPVTISISPDEGMYSVMRKFDETEAWHLPVVGSNGYMGIISKSSIFTSYRKQLIRYTSS